MKKTTFIETVNEKGDKIYKQIAYDVKLPSEEFVVKRKKDYQKIVAGILGAQQIAYNGDLCRVLKSIKAGILLNQLLYWYNKAANEYIYKTQVEIEKETALSRREQDTAIIKLKEMDLIRVELKGIPRKRYFYLNIDNIINLCEKVVEK